MLNCTLVSVLSNFICYALFDFNDEINDFNTDNDVVTAVNVQRIKCSSTWSS